MGLKEELMAIRDSAAVYEPVGSGHIRLTGPDATPYLQRMVTNEVTSLPVGEGRHNALLDRKGMVLSLFYLHRLATDSYHVVIPPGLFEKTLTLLKKFKITERFEIADLSGGWGWVQVVGMKGETVAAEEGFHWRDDFYKIPVLNIVYTKERTPSLDLPTISKSAFDLIRIESGIPEYGVDIDETHLLLDANIPHCYKRQKGCYPGQEVIERILAYGKGRTPSRLCTLSLRGAHKITRNTDVVVKNGGKAGYVTSSVIDPVIQRTVLLAYVNYTHLNSELLINDEIAETGLEYDR